MKKSITLILIFFTGIIFTSQAQQLSEVCGTVSAFNKYPLKGVTITSKKSKETVTTDQEGKYCVAVKEKDKLTVKAEGFETGYSKAGKGDPVDVNLIFKADDRAFDKVVSSGYMSSEDLRYAADHLADENNNFATYADIFTLIIGRFPGVSIGADNNGRRAVIIRGTSSLLNDPTALYVVNGIVVPSIDQISPADVESIDIVKAATSSKYGIRGANGAVEITTKKN